MPSVYTIAPNVSFVDALAHGLLRRCGGDPLALSRRIVLLPTRRACRALQEALLRASGGRPLLLPRMLPLGDLDAEELALAGGDPAFAMAEEMDLPPAMPPLQRQLLLARLIGHWGRSQAPSADQAIRLAGELSRLLDQVETEGVELDRLAELVPVDYASHWQVTLRFLAILTEKWPAIQRDHGCIGPAERRRRLLEAQAAAWRRAPPEDPVIAAGSTGSLPATAALLGVVANLPNGMLVLPGLDTGCEDAVWRMIAEDPTHPQHGLAVLLARLGIARGQVAPWPDGVPATAPEERVRIVNMALAPAAATPGWRTFADTAQDGEFAGALSEVERIDCPGPGEEAAVIALLLRHSLAEKECRAALVTPDRGLARRVAAELRRWGLAIDDSAGVPLSHTPPGTFLRLTAEMIATNLAPLALLAALKHPLAAGGRPRGEFRARVRELERQALRGPRPAMGFAGLKRALPRTAKSRGLRAWVTGLEALARPFLRALKRGRSLAEIVDAHVAFAESLAAAGADAGDRGDGAGRLWAGDAGAAAAAFIAELRAAAAAAPPLRGEAYPAFLAALLADPVVRPRYGSHPRLSIWGPLEARLQQVDVVILGGLNEATWPAEVDPGPWLSRPMRAEFGLPPPERRIGLAAHDFAQAFCARRVYLTRATRVEGSPTVPSRWLLRLDALLLALGLDTPRGGQANRWLGWLVTRQRPETPIQAPPPAPRPPVAARPRRLPVTAIETWMRNPYALYARSILALRRLDPIDADPGAAERGILVHQALEAYLKAHGGTLPDDPEAELIAIGRGVFEQAGTGPGTWAFWWPRFRRVARWFARHERARRSELTASFGEVTGSLRLSAPGGAFELIAKADRIDLLDDGSLAIVDYKTGAVPGKGSIELGFSPQLPLEAAIASAGGFAGVAAAPVSRLEYWQLTGGHPAGQPKPLKSDPAELSDAALEGLARLIAEFDRPETAYHAIPRPRWAPRFNDYDHLARTKEWAAGGPGEEGR